MKINTKVTAVIPIREGSKRIKNKNFLPINGVSLLEWKINILQRCSLIDKILITSDSERAKQIALSKKCEFSLRPSYYCDEDRCNFSEVVEYVCNGIDSEYILWSAVTSPLISVATYEYILSSISCIENSDTDCIISVERLYDYLLDIKGPINFELGSKHKKTQDLEPIYRLTGGIYLAKRKDMIAWKYLFGGNVKYEELSFPETLDINTYEDYKKILNSVNSFNSI